MKYIKLFEHSYTIYQLATMAMWEATELLFKEIQKIKPDMDLVRDLFEYALLDVNQVDRNGSTALMFASSEGHTEIVQMLLERPEIDVNVQDNEGNTALMSEATYGGNTEIVRMLLEHPKIDVNVQDEGRWTALIITSRNGNTEIVNLIKSHPKFNPNT